MSLRFRSLISLLHIGLKIFVLMLVSWPVYKIREENRRIMSSTSCDLLEDVCCPCPCVDPQKMLTFPDNEIAPMTRNRCSCKLCGPVSSDNSRQCGVIFNAISLILTTGQGLYCQDCWSYREEQRRISQIRTSLEQRRKVRRMPLGQRQEEKQISRERSRSFDK